MVVARILLPCALVLLALPARADFLRIVAAKGLKKGRAHVLVWRQQLDFVHGFDTYLLDQYDAPANKRTHSQPLAQKARKKWLPLGHYEVYLQELAAAGERLLQARVKKGFSPVCDLARFPVGRSDELTLPTGKGDIILRIKRGKRRDEIIMEKSAEKRYSLVRIQPPGGRDAPAIGSRAFVQATLVDGGRMLAVVVRTQFLPVPANRPEDTLYFFPLRRASKHLRLPYPFATDNCLESTNPWP